MKGLAHPTAFGNEVVRGCGIEGEHIKMVRDSQTRADIKGEFSRLDAIEITGDASFGFVAVNGHQRKVDAEGMERRHQPIVKNGVAAMIRFQPSRLSDVA